ncbi:hypothetical protein N7519_005946 [Penicillium mononematosum]|uniref:uncharacterized protein n=1 Tax=Penicillium mononematosum TaxID=268346 RepID=UPI00254859F6|nr:uncharacterized protein N7519_005946 [Penicillium mononematosum]KAJ6184645.1 hypothetical protein N7519_005946 [Penicillium mononematosum]
MSLDTFLYKNNVNRYNGCALEWAARHGRGTVARKSLEAGAPLLGTYPEESPPISLAARGGHEAVVKIFLEWVLRLNGGQMWWPQGPEPEWNKDLLRYDSDVTRLDDPMDRAFCYGQDSVVHLLRAYGGMAHFGQPRIAWAMLVAISEGYTAVVRFLRERYPETIDYMVHVENDQMLLSMACQTDVARILIEAGVPVDIADFWECSPL